MPYTATKEPYTLILREDELADSPRVTSDNFGTMVCFHRRYKLGDEHDYSSPEDFMRTVVRENVSNKDVINYVKSGNAQSVKLDFNRSEQSWEIKTYWSEFKKWYDAGTFESPLSKNEDVVADTLTEELSLSDLMNLAEKEICILPLYLYDHSGITMNTSGFSCQWDSGQVGWIYASNDEVLNTFLAKKLTPELTEKAESILKSEVAEYDSYLTGECYGFELYKGDTLEDSCWGFLGDPKDLQSSIEEHLPSECKGIMDNLDYHTGKVDIAEILEAKREKPSILEKLKELAKEVKLTPPNNTHSLGGEAR